MKRAIQVTFIRHFNVYVYTEPNSDLSFHSILEECLGILTAENFENHLATIPPKHFFLNIVLNEKIPNR